MKQNPLRSTGKGQEQDGGKKNQLRSLVRGQIKTLGHRFPPKLKKDGWRRPKGEVVGEIGTNKAQIRSDLTGKDQPKGHEGNHQQTGEEWGPTPRSPRCSPAATSGVASRQRASPHSEGKRVPLEREKESERFARGKENVIRGVSESHWICPK